MIELSVKENSSNFIEVLAIRHLCKE